MDWFRSNAELRLLQLDAMDVLDELNERLAAVRRRATRPPAGSGTSWPRERLRGIPLDPTGVPFVLDPATGRIGLGANSPLWPLPDGSRATPRRRES